MTTVTKSTRPVSEKEISREWHFIDMKGKTLGRVIPEISTYLQGKHKVNFAPYLDNGDFVVVVNAKELKVTGKKEAEKTYDFYSGYPGGRRTVTLGQLMKKNPKEVVRRAVSGMLPKNKMRDPRLSRLYIYEGSEHPYTDKFNS